jgi:predicted RNA binding protein YcfA (HicA-like mRNA interferase family)
MSDIDYSKLRSLTAREIISALIRDGFELNRTSGSHYQFVHPDKRRVTISYHHPGDIFRPGILKSML